MAETSPGLRKWRTSDWRALLHDAIALLDTLTEAPRWSFGGGTSLAVFYEHRVSYDVDPNRSTMSNIEAAGGSLPLVSI